jgi:hypothetical protein
MVTTLSDLNGAESSGNNSGSSDDDSGASGEYSEVREAVEAVGGDVERVIDYVKENGSEEKVLDFFANLAGNDDLHAQMERYRRWNDVHRINQFYLRDADGDYTDFTSQFYGSTDDEAGAETYNGVQQQTRDMGGNLMFYKAAFPEPQESFWDDEVVEWHPRPDDDSSIFVEKSWAQEFMPYAISIDGEQRPVPPTNDQLAEGASDSSGDGSGSNSAGEPWQFTDSGLLKVTDLTVDEVREAVKTMDNAENLRKTLQLERNQKDRKTAKEKIERQLEKVEAGDVEQDDPDYECSKCDFATDSIESLAEHSC